LSLDFGSMQMVVGANVIGSEINYGRKYIHRHME
jgi:hypothetical protein